jgi:hypothetical protein
VIVIQKKKKYVYIFFGGKKKTFSNFLLHVIEFLPLNIPNRIQKGIIITLYLVNILIKNTLKYIKNMQSYV